MLQFTYDLLSLLTHTARAHTVYSVYTRTGSCSYANSTDFEIELKFMPMELLWKGIYDAMKVFDIFTVFISERIPNATSGRM